MTLAAIEHARMSGDLPRAMDLILTTAKARGLTARLGHEYALCHMAAKHFDTARDMLTLIIAKDARYAQIWYHLAQCYEGMGEYEEAEAAYRAALTRHAADPSQPDEGRTYFALGTVLFRIGRTSEASALWQEGLGKPVTSAEGIFQRSQVCLALGHYAQGWEDFEARRPLLGFRNSLAGHRVPDILPPAWDGTQSGRVLVHGEMGAGDTICFSRYLEHVDHRFVTGANLQTWIPDTGGECQWSTPIGSLPLLLNRLTPIPPTPTWVKPQNATPRIGVCWKGSGLYSNDRDRSSPIDFRAALKDERWEVVSLQFGEGYASTGYAEDAAFLNTLDAVVTVDTSWAHLAGTAGVPTILLAQTAPFWCWGIHGTESPWYPGVHIVRRTHTDAWGEALERAKYRLVETT